MNAIEHGNGFRADIPVTIQVRASATALVVRITDQGGGRPIPETTAPDLEAKLAGLQSARGWGLFLIRNMVDDMQVSSDGDHHMVELVMHREGDTRG
jgi:anti-sigma regulatory factor (Ser/Thr protein kinase)